MRQREFQEILRKYKEGLCTPEERALVDNWFKSMELPPDQSIDMHAKSQIKQRSWERVRGHIVRSNPDATRPSSSLRVSRGPRWAIAACISIVALSAGFYFTSHHSPKPARATVEIAQRTITNDTQAEMQVLLEDGSRVVLKPHSQVSFPEPFSDVQRHVALEGEAFFDVSRDTLRPFLVHTRELVTRVLGTSFSISAFLDQDNITVSVISGKVSVVTTKEDSLSGQGNETILTPNQKIVYNRIDNVVSRGLVKEPLPIIPKEEVRRLSFEGAPIRKIFEGLELVYGVNIEFDENTFSSCILTTSIGEGSIFNRLDMICKAIDARYVIKEDKILISGTGCKP